MLEKVKDPLIDKGFDLAKPYLLQASKIAPLAPLQVFVVDVAAGG